EVTDEVLRVVRAVPAERSRRDRGLRPHAMELTPDTFIATLETARVARRHRPAVHHGGAGEGVRGRRVRLPGTQLIADQAGHDDISTRGDTATRGLTEFV